jgi:ribosomal protein S18 acetylase RimI-like enzyme
MEKFKEKIIEIRFILNEDLIINKSILLYLLEENLRINFPNIKNLTELAKRGYENILRFQSDGSAILIGAFKGETIIGFLWAYQREVLGEQRLHIDHIIVDSKDRSCGIGTRLLNTLEGIANEKGLKKIELMTTVANEKTMKFYNLNGFVTVRVQLEKELGEPHDY